MIYEFQLPCIVDTKNIFSTFTKKKYVAKENWAKIKKINKQRKELKETLKYLNMCRIEEIPPYNLIDDALTYADIALELNGVFDVDYPITKNWKWSPVFTQAKVLKFGSNIKSGKSGEIIMSRLAAFSACFRQVRGDTAFVKQNIIQKDDNTLAPEMTFSSLMKKNPNDAKLEDSIQRILKAHVKGWTVLKKYYDRSSPFFKNLANYSERYMETTPAGMEIALILAKINANVLYIEYLRLQNNFEEMGKYAKMIVTQAFLVENQIKIQKILIDPRLFEFVHVCQKLYKAIALWSLFFPYMAKLKTDTYNDGEDINVLAGGCVTFIHEISSLHKSILSLQGISMSPVFGVVSLYFKDILVPKSLEVTKTYGEVFGNFHYDEIHFNKMLELDYISRMTGDESM